MRGIQVYPKETMLPYWRGGGESGRGGNDDRGSGVVMAVTMIGLVIVVVMSTPETMVSLTSSFHTRGIITDGCYCFSV